MKRWIPQLSFLTLLVAVPLGLGLGLLAPIPAAWAAGGDHPGKVAFLAQKCNLCHSIDSLGIAATTKSQAMRGPDLSDTAGKRTEEWLRKWLRREETIDGKKHKKQFTGTDAELADVVAFLGTLKGK